MSTCEMCQNSDICKYREQFIKYEECLEQLSTEISKLMDPIPHYAELKHLLVCKHYRPFSVMLRFGTR